MCAGDPAQVDLSTGRLHQQQHRNESVSTLHVFFFSIIVFSVLGSVWSHSCPDCDPSACDPPPGCKGGVVPDFCGCCQVCARLANQSCGGEFQLFGRCDRDLLCVVDLTSRQLVTGDEQGTCLSAENSCSSLHSTYGCNIVSDRCRCTNITSCARPEFEFKTMPDCEIDLAVRLARRDNKANDCSGVRCGVVHELKCPGDSEVVSSDVLPGQCCPSERRCQCDPARCPAPPMCSSEYELTKVRSANNIPGQCCDHYECQLNGRNCTGVKCQDNEVECPEDSYRLPRIISVDSCCSIPQGCSCLPNLCKRVVCPGKSHVKILKYSTGKPGSCCHVFTCVDVSDMSCTYEGEHYEERQVWHPDRCKKCHCMNGLVFCRAIQCPDLPACGRVVIPDQQCCPVCIGCVSMAGKAYNNSETWKEDDCTTCTCSEGQVNCQAASCEVTCKNPRKVPGQCCPVCNEPTVIKTVAECRSLTNCNITCKYGMKKDLNGCYICQCAKDIKMTISNELGGEHACLVDMIAYEEGASWYDGCRKCYCHKGKEMCALITCPVPKCSNPVIRKGECCPRCAGVDNNDSAMNSSVAMMTVCQAVDGNYYMEGETWYLNKCTECICHEGHVLCEVQSCAPAPCPKPVYDEKKCCPYCPAPTQHLPNILDIPCLSENGLIRYDDGATWQPTSCRSCTCNHGYIDCYSLDCTAVKCNRPVLRKNQCCPVCLDIFMGDSCRVENIIYNHEEKWSIDSCTSCTCLNGQVMCTKKLCNANCKNPIQTPGECCPICQGSSKNDSENSKHGSNTIYIPTQIDGKSDVNPPYAKREQKQPYMMIICLTIISVLVLVLILLFFCCWKQRKKLLHYEHSLGPVATPRPKSTNLDFSHDRNTYCSALYMEKNNRDCDYNMLGHTGHYNTYSAPPVKNVV